VMCILLCAMQQCDGVGSQLHGCIASCAGQWWSGHMLCNSQQWATPAEGKPWLFKRVTEWWWCAHTTTGQQ
jgi:hypothetical protein